MAYWFRKRGKVYVCVNIKGGKPKALPREKTKHLDAEESHNIDAWTNQTALHYEGKRRKVTPDNIVLASSDLGQLRDGYLDYLKGRKRRPQTIDIKRYMFDTYIFPFFLQGDTPLRDPAQWPGKSIKLFQWLQSQSASEATINHVNATIKGFYRWLVEEGRIVTGVDIRLRGPIAEDRVTPLKKLVTPVQVLDFVAVCHRRDIRLMALLGYFFSLRPQELFALNKRSFVGGSRSVDYECFKVMRAKGLYGKLLINVTRQRTKLGDFTAPKAYSRGYVACFNEKAARLIAEELQAIATPDELFFEFMPNWSMCLWREHGMNATLKDLRRASLYHLGHHTDFSADLINLMKHARHQNSKTTELYLRRPEEDAIEYQELDLDA